MVFEGFDPLPNFEKEPDPLMVPVEGVRRVYDRIKSHLKDLDFSPMLVGQDPRFQKPYKLVPDTATGTVPLNEVGNDVPVHQMAQLDDGVPLGSGGGSRTPATQEGRKVPKWAARGTGLGIIILAVALNLRDSQRPLNITQNPVPEPKPSPSNDTGGENILPVAQIPLDSNNNIQPTGEPTEVAPTDEPTEEPIPPTEEPPEEPTRQLTSEPEPTAGNPPTPETLSTPYCTFDDIERALANLSDFEIETIDGSIRTLSELLDYSTSRQERSKESDGKIMGLIGSGQNPDKPNGWVIIVPVKEATTNPRVTLNENELNQFGIVGDPNGTEVLYGPDGEDGDIFYDPVLKILYFGPRANFHGVSINLLYRTVSLWSGGEDVSAEDTRSAVLDFINNRITCTGDPSQVTQSGQKSNFVAKPRTIYGYGPGRIPLP